MGYGFEVTSSRFTLWQTMVSHADSLGLPALAPPCDLLPNNVPLGLWLQHKSPLKVGTVSNQSLCPLLLSGPSAHKTSSINITGDEYDGNLPNSFVSFTKVVFCAVC